MAFPTVAPVISEYAMVPKQRHSARDRRCGVIYPPVWENETRQGLCTFNHHARFALEHDDV